MTFPQLERLAREFRLVLGSRSPRRVMLLRELGLEFEQIVPEVEERMLPDEAPFPYALRLAEDKARWVLPQLTDGQLAITCDTIVVLGDRVLEKPVDEDDAFRILSTLAGHQHTVCTSVALTDCDGIRVSDYETTGVIFNDVQPEQIREYIASGEPMDKAGAYGIQGMGAFLVDRIEGNLDTVVGLPRTLLDRLAGDINAKRK